MKEAESWERFAACKGRDTNLWFPDQTGPVKQGRVARSICEMCLVKDECRDAALKRNEPDGIFGGMNKAERNRYKRRILKIAIYNPIT